MRGSFPLNGTYFQVNEVNAYQANIYLILTSSEQSNEKKKKNIYRCLSGLNLTTFKSILQMFADHDTSVNPIDVPRNSIWNLRRRTVYFGTSVTSIFRGKQNVLYICTYYKV